MNSTFKNYKKLLNSLCVNYLDNPGEKIHTPDELGEGKKVVDLIEEILTKQEGEEFGKIDQKDLANVKELSNRMKDEQSEIFNETKEATSQLMKEQLSIMLEKGYTIENEDSYNTLQKLLETFDIGYKLPTQIDSKVLKDITNPRIKLSISSSSGVLKVYSDGVGLVNKRIGYFNSDGSFEGKERLFAMDNLSNNNKVTINSEKFAQLKEKAQADKIKALSDNNTKLKKNVEKLTGDLEALSIKLSEAIEERNNLDADNKNLKVRVEKLGKVIEKAEQDITKLKDTITKLKGDLESAKKQIKELTDKVKQLETNLSKSNEDNQALKTEVKKLKSELETSKKNNEDLTNKVAELEGKLQDIENLKKLQQVKEQIISSYISGENLKNEPTKDVITKLLKSSELKYDNNDVDLIINSIKDYRKKQPQASKKESVQSEKLNQQKLSSAKAFYEKVNATEDDIKAIQKALLDDGYELPKFGDDGDFGGETYNVLEEFQYFNELTENGKAGTKTLRQLGLITDQETSKDFYNKKKKPQAKQDTKKDKQPLKNPIKELKKEGSAKEEPTILERKGENFKDIKKWIPDLFKGDKVESFVGINGDEVNIDFDEKTFKFTFDTGFFDNISDNEIDLQELLKNERISDIQNPEAAKAFVKRYKEKMENIYNEKVLDHAIASVTTEKYNGGTDRNRIKNNIQVIEEFENSDGKDLKVKLIRKYVRGEFDGVYLKIGTTFSNKASVKLKAHEITKETIKAKTEELKKKLVKEKVEK